MVEAVAIIATIFAHPENRGEVEAALRRAVIATLQEPGCEQYALHFDRHDANRFVMIERWRDKASIDAHATGRAFTELAAVLNGRATLQVILYDPVECQLKELSNESHRLLSKSSD
jgi:quinol monooxygenase YgiN